MSCREHCQKKTLDIDKIKEAIKTLEEAREILDNIEDVLPGKRVVPAPYYPWPWRPYPYRDVKPWCTGEFRWNGDSPPDYNVTITMDNTTYNG